MPARCRVPALEQPAHTTRPCNAHSQRQAPAARLHHAQPAHSTSRVSTGHGIMPSYLGLCWCNFSSSKTFIWTFSKFIPCSWQRLLSGYSAAARRSICVQGPERVAGQSITTSTISLSRKPKERVGKKWAPKSIKQFECCFSFSCNVDDVEVDGLHH